MFIATWKYVAASLLIAAGASASAADLEPLPYSIVPAYSAAYSWTGFYVGFNVGGGWTKGHKSSDLTFDGGDLTSSNGESFLSPRAQHGFGGGGQVGYNFQRGPFVVGFEADLQTAGIGSRNNANLTDAGATYGIASGLPLPPSSPGNIAFFNTGIANQDRLAWYGTVRGRAGFALDRLFIYGTGGIAFADAPSALDNNVSSGRQLPFSFYQDLASARLGSGISATGSITSWRDYVGVVGGAGLEFAFTDRFSLKAEALLLHFGHKGCCGAGQIVGITSTGVAIVSTGGSGAFNYSIARLGLNYKFKSGF